MSLGNWTKPEEQVCLSSNSLYSPHKISFFKKLASGLPFKYPLIQFLALPLRGLPTDVGAERLFLSGKGLTYILLSSEYD